MSLSGLEGAKKPLSPSTNSSLPRINLNNNLIRWFSRNLGLWSSRRQYFFEDKSVLYVDMMLKVEAFSKYSEHGEPRYRFTWWPENEYDFFIKKPTYKKNGEMLVTLSGHQLHRSSFYLNDLPGKSNIRQVDEHEVIFDSNYKNLDVLEHTRLIDEDRYRSRVIYTWEDRKLIIAEQHHETRLECESAPIED